MLVTARGCGCLEEANRFSAMDLLPLNAILGRSRDLSAIVLSQQQSLIDLRRIEILRICQKNIEHEAAACFPLTWTSATRDAVTEAFSTGGNNSCGGGAHTSTTGSVTPTVGTANGTFGFAGTSGATAIATWGP
ncbi:hypothetical protein ABIB73_000237 [Bradyrhizobium sp. F1.4.3]|uniref:hypothetical protein n=1 Tax=Bradyrhizobium sp. F1.4.3 TaxID=3156356 RepID=UPI0033986B91